MSNDEQRVLAFDVYNMADTGGGVSKTLNSIRSDSDHVPVTCYEVIALEGNGIRPSHFGNGWSSGGAMYTLNTIERNAVCYQVDLIAESRGAYETYQGGQPWQTV